MYALMWSSTLIGAALISGGAPNYLLRELPARRALGLVALPTWPTLRLVAAVPVLLAALFVAASTVAEPVWPAQWPEAGQSRLVIIAALAYHFISCQSMLFRVHIGPSTGMMVRDAVPHILLLAAGAITLRTGNPSATNLIAIFAGLSFGANVMLLAVLWRGTGLRLSREAPPFRPGVTAFWANGAFGALTANLDIVLAGVLFAPQSVGVYAIVKRLGNFVSLPQVIANCTAATMIAEAHARVDMRALQNCCLRGLKVALAPAIVFAVLIYALLPFWARLFAIPYTEALSILALVIIAGNLVNVLFGATFIVASQCGFEARALSVRVVTTVFLVVAALGCDLFGEVSPILLALFWSASIVLTNALLWRTLYTELLVDTSVWALARRRGARLARTPVS